MAFEFLEEKIEDLKLENKKFLKTKKLVID